MVQNSCADGAFFRVTKMVGSRSVHGKIYSFGTERRNSRNLRPEHFVAIETKQEKRRETVHHQFLTSSKMPHPVWHPKFVRMDSGVNEEFS